MSNTSDDGATPVVEPAVEPAAEPKPTETVEFWKTQARENEKRAKANADAAKELDKLRAGNMTELEKAIADTKTATRTEVLREVGESRVEDLVRVAAAGRPVDIDALLEGLDKKRFVNDDGKPDTAQIKAWVDRVAPPGDERKPRVPAGVRDSGTSKGTPASDFANFLGQGRT